MRSLTVASFDLDATPPTVSAEVRYHKRRKRHAQVITPELADELRQAFADKVPGAAAFAMPDKYRLADTIRADLAAARTAWIAKAPEGKARLRRQRSDFLVYLDHQGLVADFYSMRHCHGTLLAKSGATPKDVQASLHHTQGSTT